MEIPDVLPLGAVKAIIWSFTSVAAIATAVRIYTRIFIVRAFGQDDALIIFGQILALALAALTTWHVHLLFYFRQTFKENSLEYVFSIKGIGKDANEMFFSGFLSEVVYMLTLPIIKCAILAFYGRIVPSRKQRMMLYTIAFVILAQALVSMQILIFALDPPSAWQKFYTSRSHYRYNTDHNQVIYAAFQVLYDLILLLLPLPVIFKTNLRGRDRAGLIFIYLLCSISLVATGVRLSKVTKFSIFDDDVDSTKPRVQCVYWLIIEVMTALLCANIPTMPAFFRQMFKNIRIRSVSATDYNKSSFERVSDTVLSVFRKPVRQNHPGLCVKEYTKDEHSMRHMGAFESKRSANIVQSNLRRGSDTREASFVSCNSTSDYGVDSTPTKRAASD